MRYEAILFDCDGVLVTLPSKRVMHEAAQRTFARFDLDHPSNAAVRELLAGDLRAISERCREANIDRRAFCAAAAREAVSAQRRELEAGLRSLHSGVDCLRSLSAVLGVVSDNHRRVLSLLLERFGLTGLFETVHGCSFSPDGLERRKPNPHNLQAAMAALDTVAETTLYVGDRPVDVEAATRAGVDSALVCRPAGTGNTQLDNGTVVDPGDRIGECSPTYRIGGLRDLSGIAAVV